jgi:hypothetical protein
MVGRPQAEACAVSGGGADDLHILHREGSAKLHEIDAEAQGRGQIDQVFGLTAGEAGIARPLGPKRIDEAGILEHLIGG